MENNTADERPYGQTIITARLIFFSVLTALLLFFVLAVVIRIQGNANIGEDFVALRSTLTLVNIVFLIGCVGITFLNKYLMVRKAVAESTTPKEFAVRYFTVAIVCMASAEAPGIFACINIIIGSSLPVCIGVVVLSVAFLFFFFPSEGALEKRLALKDKPARTEDILRPGD